MKILLVPGNNSLSHISKSLAIKEALTSRGHEVLIAVSQERSEFLKRLGYDHTLLPDVQESDKAEFPTINWFRDQKRILDCIQAEVDLLKAYRPHRTMGIFRFTLKASARIVGVPFDSLICGCMLPGLQEVLGFSNDDPDLEFQRNHMNLFFRSAGLKTSRALTMLGLDEIEDIREMLTGERTFLWDFPEFMPIPRKRNIFHVGPLEWDEWPYDSTGISEFHNDNHPIAVLGFGTCGNEISVIERMINILLDLDYRIVVAAGGQDELLDLMPEELRVSTCLFAPLRKILPRASLIISHGGQMTVFEALNNEVPVIVMPFQPEQAHNGVCLERIGCGRRLVPSRPFFGSPNVYIEALNRMTDDDIRSAILDLVRDPQTMTRLAAIRETIGRYNAVRTLTSFLGEG
jgi:UDP:flavonoid glycosyltransferase YjiC (YdhE family)